MPDITSSTTVLILSIPLLLPVPQQLQGWAADDIFSTARVVPVETMMGLDGTLSGGYIPTEKKMEIVLMAGSADNDFFDAWQAGQDASLAALPAFGMLTLPALGRAFTLINGYLTGYPPMSDGKKVLQPRRYEITWESIVGSPIGNAG